MMDNKQKVEINMVDLLLYLRKKVIWVLAVCILCTALGYVGTKLLVEPEYTASTRVYVLNRTNENMVVYADYQISTQMLSDYKVLITGQNVTQEVVEKLELDISPSALARKIVVSAPEGTRFVQISVTDTDPVRAANIANMVRQVASVQIRDLMDVDAVNLVYEAEVPKDPSAPNVIKQTILSGICGLAAVLAVFVVIYLLDDTIRTEEDVNRYLKLSVMGVIPLTGELETNMHVASKRKKLKHGRRVGLAERNK